jgi:adenylosuccinate lyase
MELNQLTAISPLDGRYRGQVKNMAQYFSEFGLIRYRVLVEIEYFISLCELPLPQLKGFPHEQFPLLREVYQNFSEKDALKVKEIEKKINHDVKAVEYFIKSIFEKLHLNKYQEFIHFGLTSQDINNTAVPLSLKESLEGDLLPLIYIVEAELAVLGKEWAHIPMLAKTHGQPASPTRLGKEILVFHERIENQLSLLKKIPFAAKFGGATGNFNAHHIAYPDIDWLAFADGFIEGLHLKRSKYTTQIEHYDHLAALCDTLKRICTILIDLDRDFWQYISMGYFKQKINEHEVGSSAMPHKVNPIDFENSEGNLGMAIALFEHFSAKLPVSRLQRDLTDSTVLRNLGVPLSHLYIGLKSLVKGLEKVELNKEVIHGDLENNWIVVAEGIQTILRREGYAQPYEALKALTRKNEKINAETIVHFIDGLDVSITVKEELKRITPFNYTGIKF